VTVERSVIKEVDKVRDFERSIEMFDPMLQQESNIYGTNICITENTWILPVAFINTF
jgi:hypothetical protein